ncbi:CBS domain-containing protein [Amphibacillus indicireducens]|uniref:CBS domain-containing protein n=1 Tax=Amphibacillus indicireducens TaxID=1076330 RepID=A0ABP7V9U8_9BACI
MERAERFIVAFNKIEKYFNQQLNDTSYVPFFRAVLRLRKKDAIVNRYHNDLLEYSELRNAIVHERTEVNYTIADPHIEIVEAIEKIAAEMTAPKLVIPTFAKTLKVVQADLTVKTILNVIRETRFTQFPVYRSKQFVGLLTDKTVLHWIAHHMNGDFAELLKTPIMKLIDDNGAEPNYRFIPRSMDIYQAEELLLDMFKKHEGIAALLITEDGKPNQKLLGMVTPSDLIRVP